MTGIDVICRYRDPVKAPLLHATVLPAVRETRRPGVRVHLERHWLHGPHVTVALHGANTAEVADTAARLRAKLERGLATRPSISVITDEELLDAAVRSGRAELVPGPYTPIEADNTVQVVPSDRRALADLLGGAGAVEVRAQLLTAAVDLVETVVAPQSQVSSTPAARVAMTTSAMAVHAAHYGHGVLGGYVSFLSHLEDFLFLHDVNGDLRAGFERVWQRDPARVVRRVEAALNGPADPVTAAWSRWSATALALAGTGFAAGDIPLLPGEAYRRRAVELDDVAARRQWDRTDHDLSEFHRLVGPAFDVEAVAAVFGPYRFATNVLYQVLLLCDVTATERYLAAFLFCRAVGAITGSDWREVVTARASAS